MTSKSKSAESLLSADLRAEIDHWVAKYPQDQRRSAVMAALSAVQESNGGYLSTELMDAVADYLGMEKISVYEVATFYSMYEQEPVGRHVISVCTNISCMLCGAESVVKYLEEKLGIKLGETTSDGRFTLKEVECLAACDGAPMFQIGLKPYGNLDPTKIDAILKELK